LCRDKPAVDWTAPLVVSSAHRASVSGSIRQSLFTRNKFDHDGKKDYRGNLITEGEIAKLQRQLKDLGG
jgi:hypothetical protein